MLSQLSAVPTGESSTPSTTRIARSDNHICERLKITIESTFATVRLRTKVTKGPGSRAAGIAMAYKLIDAVVLAASSHVSGGSAYTAVTSTASTVSKPRVRRRDLTVLRTW